MVKEYKNQKNKKNNQPTDRRTKRGVESLSARLKIGDEIEALQICKRGTQTLKQHPAISMGLESILLLTKYFPLKVY